MGVRPMAPISGTESIDLFDEHGDLIGKYNPQSGRGMFADFFFERVRTCHMENHGSWNADALALLICDACGGMTYENIDGTGSPAYCPECGAKVVESR